MPERLRICLLTPAGKGAVATLALTGKGAVDMAARFVKRLGKQPLSEAKPTDVVVAHFLAQGQTVGEELVVVVESAERVLLHPHGGAAAVEAMQATFESAGCERQTWEAQLQSEASDPTRVAADLLLAEAKTLAVARLLLDQREGAFDIAIKSIEQSIEAADFAKAQSLIQRLQDLASLGNAICQGGFRLVVAGRPNVGKSRLINRWLGYDRAIVFDQPGTTRDILETPLALGGWPFVLLDTAGLRETNDPIESEGISRAHEAIQKADLVLLLFDASQGWTEADQRLHDWMRESFADEVAQEFAAKILLVQNKSDLMHADGASAKVNAIAISAQTGAGMDALEATILERLLPVVPTCGEAVPITPVQVVAIAKLAAVVRAG